MHHCSTVFTHWKLMGPSKKSPGYWVLQMLQPVADHQIINPDAKKHRDINIFQSDPMITLIGSHEYSWINKKGIIYQQHRFPTLWTFSGVTRNSGALGQNIEWGLHKSWTMSLIPCWRYRSAYFRVDSLDCQPWNSFEDSYFGRGWILPTGVWTHIFVWNYHIL